MKANASRSTTSVVSTSVKARMSDVQQIKFLEKQLHNRILGRREIENDKYMRPIWSSTRERALRVARKRARDSAREVLRLNALVIKLAEKL